MDIQWPDLNIFAFGNTVVDCGSTLPSDIKERLVKSAKLLRWQKKQTDDTEDGMWSEPIRTF